MVTLTFNLLFVETVIANIVGTLLIITTPHALLLGIATESTVVTLAVFYELTVVMTPDANGIVADFLQTTGFADVKVTFLTAVEIKCVLFFFSLSAFSAHVA